MQVNHKVAIIRMLKEIQNSYHNNADELNKWIEFEQKISKEIDSYSLGHKLAIFKTIQLLVRSLDRIYSAKQIVEHIDYIINK